VATEARRRELGALLRARREQLTRAEFGLPAVGRGRKTGLRREEVSYLSGVSGTWYTWLEQGRDIQPSRQVLDAVAGTLRLSPAERDYVLSLAGYAPEPRPEAGSAVREAPTSVQRLLDAQTGLPSFCIALNWDILGWNAAYAALFPGIGASAPADRNLLLLVFTDPYVRALLPDWETDSRRFLAQFRAEVGPFLAEPSVAALIARLHAESPAFRAGWDDHDLESFVSTERRFHHPRVGDLRLEHHQLTPSDHPLLHVVIYLPAAGDERTATALGEIAVRQFDDP
jgi:transcriptional regulator with XRE-family HTH domain